LDRAWTSAYDAKRLQQKLTYQLSGTIFQPQPPKQTVCLFSVVDSRHICLLLLLKTVVNCNVASASVSLHTFSFMIQCGLHWCCRSFQFNSLWCHKLQWHHIRNKPMCVHKKCTNKVL